MKIFTQKWSHQTGTFHLHLAIRTPLYVKVRLYLFWNGTHFFDSPSSTERRKWSRETCLRWQSNRNLSFPLPNPLPPSLCRCYSHWTRPCFSMRACEPAVCRAPTPPKTSLPTTTAVTSAPSSLTTTPRRLDQRSPHFTEKSTHSVCFVTLWAR